MDNVFISASVAQWFTCSSAELEVISSMLVRAHPVGGTVNCMLIKLMAVYGFFTRETQ